MFPNVCELLATNTTAITLYECQNMRCYETVSGHLPSKRSAVNTVHLLMSIIDLVYTENIAVHGVDFQQRDKHSRDTGFSKGGMGIPKFFDPQRRHGDFPN